MTDHVGARNLTAALSDQAATSAAEQLHGVRDKLPLHALEKEMATHSSVLAWRIPGMEEPGGLQSMG